MVSEKSLANLRPFKKGEPMPREYVEKSKERKKKLMSDRQKMKDELNAILKISLRRGDIKFAEDILNLEEAEKANLSVQTAINIAMIKRAMMGDVQAAQYLRDTVGDKPTDKVEIDQSLTVEEWAKNHKVKL